MGRMETDTIANKIPKKIPRAQEREQFAAYLTLKNMNVTDDDIVLRLGIRDSIQAQIDARLHASNGFAHFKEWKKLMLKPQKVVKAAAKRVKKTPRHKFILTDYDKKRIPDAEHGMFYYVEKHANSNQPGPQVFRDNFERTFVGHWVDGMIEPEHI